MILCGGIRIPARYPLRYRDRQNKTAGYNSPSSAQIDGGNENIIGTHLL
jgi:hypothetical protein